jgi:hypothetical protein
LASGARAEEMPAADGAVLPDALAEHFRVRGITVDPRQLPQRAESPAAQPDAAEAAGRLRLDVFRRATSATIATIPFGRGDRAIAWTTAPARSDGGPIDRLTAVRDLYGRTTAHFSPSGKIDRFVTDRGEEVAIHRSGDHPSLSVWYYYGYARDERFVDLPDRLEGAPEAAPAAPGQRGGDVRRIRLSAKACPYWPKARQLIDAWVDIDPDRKLGGPDPAWFPLDRRTGTGFATALNIARLGAVRRDPDEVEDRVEDAIEEACEFIGESEEDDLCRAFGGEAAPTAACRRILDPFAAGLCPAFGRSAGWNPAIVKENTHAFDKPLKLRFNVRFLSPYGYSWVTSTPVKTFSPRNRDISASVDLPCWDVYEAPLKMTGVYHWPTCTSPYAEATSTLQFANYMKGSYTWAALSNWTLTVYQTPDCLSSNYVEGPFTPAGPAKRSGNYALWRFDNQKYGGPDFFTGHINFKGNAIWGNVEDKRRSRRTSARATLYGEFSGRRAR